MSASFKEQLLVNDIHVHQNSRMWNMTMPRKAFLLVLNCYRHVTDTVSRCVLSALPKTEWELCSRFQQLKYLRAETEENYFGLEGVTRISLQSLYKLQNQNKNIHIYENIVQWEIKSYYTFIYIWILNYRIALNKQCFKLAFTVNR